MNWPWSRTPPAAPRPEPPTATEVLQDQVLYLRKCLERECLISEHLREEVLTLSSSKARQEIEYYRAMGAMGPPQPQKELTPEQTAIGLGVPWGDSLVAEGHIPTTLDPEEARLEREARDRDKERQRQAEEREDAGA